MKRITGKGDEQFLPPVDDDQTDSAFAELVPWYTAAAVIFVIGLASWAVGVFG